MAEFIKQSWLFPAIQSIHIIGLTLLAGTICLVDLRLLGVSMGRHATDRLVSLLAPWTSAGLIIVLTTGPVLFGADLARYVKNPAFVVKMMLLATALGAHFTLHRRAVMDDGINQSAWQKPAALLSLILWSGVVLAGRAIADFDIRF